MTTRMRASEALRTHVRPGLPPAEYLGLHRYGYRVDDSQGTDESWRLTVSVYDHGGFRLSGPSPVYALDTPPPDVPAAHGHLSRARQFIEALCRFRNTGGFLGEAYNLLRAFEAQTEHYGAPLPSLAPVAGITYLGAADAEPAPVAHLYALDDTPGFLRVVEGCYTEPVDAPSMT